MFHVNNLLWIDHKWGDLVKFSSPIFLLDPTNCIFFTLFKSLTIAVYGLWLNRSILKVSSCLFAQYTQQQVSKYQMWPFIYSKASIKTHKKYSLFLPIKKKIQQFKEMFASKLKSYTETSCKQIILAGLYILINTCEYHW